MTLPEILKEFYKADGKHYEGLSPEEVCQFITKSYIAGLQEAKGLVKHRIESLDKYDEEHSIVEVNLEIAMDFIDSKIKELTETK